MYEFYLLGTSSIVEGICVVSRYKLYTLLKKLNVKISCALTDGCSGLGRKSPVIKLFYIYSLFRFCLDTFVCNPKSSFNAKQFLHKAYLK